MQGLPQFSVLAHPIGFAADIDDVAVVQDPIDERGCHDFSTEHLAPFLEALV